LKKRVLIYIGKIETGRISPIWTRFSWLLRSVWKLNSMKTSMQRLRA